MSKDNVVYGIMVKDPERKLKTIPTDYSNDDNTLLCIYVGKTTRGIEQRSSEHDGDAHREFKKTGERYASYDYLKSQMIRMVEKFGLEYETVELCELTDGEEFEQYVKFMRAGHPCTNMKACDKYTNFKDDLEELYRQGLIETKDDLQFHVNRLKHEQSMASDVDYVAREERRVLRANQFLIKQFIINNIPEWITSPIEVGFISITPQSYQDAEIRVRLNELIEFSKKLKVASGILFPVERAKLVGDLVTHWNGVYFNGKRLKTRNVRDLIIDYVIEHFATAEEFAASLGFLTDNTLKSNGLWLGELYERN